jgi:predicted amidohydrolase YtcJ
VTIDLAGRAVTPGLVDGHCHLHGLGMSLEIISLRGVRSAEEAAERVRDGAARFAPGEWIVGRGWDQNLWTPPQFPTHATLDAVIPDRPVALRRIDGHALWANAAAMKLAGVGASTRDPDGGRVVRDASGAPTGVFVDAAMELIEHAIGGSSLETTKRRILAGAREAVAAGITGVHEMGIGDQTVRAYRELAAEGKLDVRVYAFLDGSLLEELPRREPDLDPDGAAMVVVRGIKLYADGALGSRGAWLLAPYSDDPGNTGLVIASPAELRHAVEVTSAHGWQLAVHAIGDGANRAVLDAVEHGGARTRTMRFRIEHAQVVDRADFGRFAALGVLASMQPTHATSDMGWADERLGPARLAGAYAWRSLRDAGARLVGGSDFPIEEVPPLHGIYAAVTRQDRAGKPEGGWRPEQRLTLEEALRMFTVEPAYASFEEGRRGAIVPGAVADLTVFDRDLRADAASLLETRVDLTVVGGRIVYDRPR